MKQNPVFIIQYLIAHIDKQINTQIKSVLHHPQFQELESSWRGLNYLATEIAALDEPHIKLRMLNISWRELSKDLSRAIEFDQSQLFAKIYSAEFGHPGGEPFGLLIGDYQINHRTINQYANDIDTLQRFSKISAAAFAPFITSINPAFFGLNDFSGLERPLHLERLFQQTEYTAWKIMQQDEDTRFLGLVLPRIRLNSSLFGNASYCFAVIATRAFAQNGWFADMRTLRQENITDLCITDSQEKILSDWGFIALCRCKYTTLSAFYNYHSLHQSKHYNSKAPTANAQLSCMINYLLCISRFAHYLKVIGRDKTGIFTNAAHCEYYLQNWLKQYTAAGADLSPELKAKYPLNDARVSVQTTPGKAGTYYCVMHLKPHGHIEHLELRSTLC